MEKTKPFEALRTRIRAYYGSNSLFAKALGVSNTTLSYKLNAKIAWRDVEIKRACDLLEISPSTMHNYFLPQM